MVKALDLTGQTFGQLRALARGSNDAHGKAQWACACSCGQTTLARASNLANGYTKSCGVCEVAHPTKARPIRYRIKSCLGSYHPSGERGVRTYFGWGMAVDATTGVILHSRKPVLRRVEDRAMTPSAHACMNALFKQGLIGGRNNRTLRRWAQEEGVNTDETFGAGSEDQVWDTYYEMTGTPRPVEQTRALHPSQAPREIVEIDPRTPEEIYQTKADVAALMAEWSALPTQPTLD